MELERNIRSIANKVNNPSLNKGVPNQNSNQGIATLIVMIAVLTIIILFCCFAAPGIRGLCKKYIFRCPFMESDMDNVYSRRYGYGGDEFSVVSESQKQNNNKGVQQPQNPQPQQ